MDKLLEEGDKITKFFPLKTKHTNYRKRKLCHNLTYRKRTIEVVFQYATCASSGQLPLLLLANRQLPLLAVGARHKRGS